MMFKSVQDLLLSLLSFKHVKNIHKQPPNNYQLVTIFLNEELNQFQFCFMNILQQSCFLIFQLCYSVLSILYYQEIIMTNYDHLSTLQTIFMTIIAVATNLAGVPIIALAAKINATYFEAVIIAMSILTSIAYHICEIYNFDIFLSQLQWHRLDNIFAITAFELIILHAFGSITNEDVILRWSTLMSSIIIQQKDPWNVAYTVTPCLLYVVLAIVIRITNRFQRKVIYNRRWFLYGLSSLLLGLWCFSIGLDDANDYLRLFHGLWHVLASGFGYCCFKSVIVRKDKKGDDGWISVEWE